jgi:RNA polymerase sigma-70 factor (ECF subfamily)
VFHEMTYEKAAEVLKSKTGTVKSRVNRARVHLAKLLGYDASELGGHTIYQAVT